MLRTSLAGACALLAAGHAAANLVSNGGFEGTPFAGSFDGVFTGDTTLTGWTIDGAGVVHVGTFWQHAAGNHSVELNWFNPGGISQTLATTPGQMYELQFDMAGQVNVGPAVKQMQVFWDGALVSTQSFNVSGKSHVAMGWERRTVSLPPAATAATVLRFYGSTPGSGDGGPALDNVSVLVDSGNFLPADFDEDHDVDAGDLALWTAGFGRTDAAHEHGDADADQDADGQDFLLWQQQLGMVEPPAIPIPEPAACAGFAIALATLALKRRRATQSP